MAADGAMRVFITVWLGQVVSILGSGLTRFAIGVWVFERTGSATQFSFIAFASAAMIILASPVAGVLVDRWDRRRCLLVSNCGAALCTLGLAVLLALDRLEVWQIYLLVAGSAAFEALQFPALSAAITLLVPKRHLARSAGMVQLGQSGSQVLSPLVAGAMMGAFGITSVILVDFATFLAAIVTLLAVRIPRPRESVASGSWLGDLTFGWTYIRQRLALLYLLGYYSVLNFLVPLCMVLLPPMILSFAGPRELGLVMGIGSGSALAGSLLMSVWGGPRRRMTGIFASGPLVAAGLIVIGLRPSLTLIAAGLLAFYAMVPVLNACSQALWQAKVAPAVQGRVFATRRMVAQCTGPIAFLIAGPLADRVFIPLLVPGGPLAESAGPLLGVGPGRGIGLLFLLAGLGYLLVHGLALASRRLRHLEDDLPDAVLEQAPQSAALAGIDTPGPKS